MPDPPGTPAPTPAAPGLIDEAINSDVGLLFSPEAPRATSVTEKKEDQRAVWACVPPTFDLDKPTVLIYLHGFNGYVTVSKTAPTGVIRKTEQGGWVANFRNDGRRGNRAGTRASGPKYKIDQTFTNHSPLVLVPEVGLPNLQSAVSVDAVRAARIKFETDTPHRAPPRWRRRARRTCRRGRSTMWGNAEPPTGSASSWTIASSGSRPCPRRRAGPTISTRPSR